MKIFEIGLMKTGTTSLGKAYELLGLKHKGWDSKLHNEWKNNIFENIFKEIEKFDAFEDGPWHNMDFKILDNKYPHSKFIFLDRNNDDWILSLEKHTSPNFNVNNIEKKFLNYNWVTQNRENLIKKIIESKEKKKKEIEDYFKNRPNDLLIMNINEGWEPLCSFLNKPVPDIKFPHLNKSIMNNE